MVKQKQQVISRFFTPKPKATDSDLSSSSSASAPSSFSSPSKVAATVSFSPSKRLRATQFSSPRKVPRLSHNYEDSNQSLPTKPSQNPTPPLSNPSLHEKFLKKLLEPDEQQLEPSRCDQIRNSKYTPLEQQVVELKAKYPDVLLMVEVGYKYRFFGEDAENAARVLGIYAHMDRNFLTASVPTFRLHVHLRRLVNAGYKVGVVKQMETAAIKSHGSNKLGPFCRGLSSLYTKATLEAGEHLGGRDEGCGSCSNYLVCVVERMTEDVEEGVDVRIGAVGIEVSTGDLVYGEFNDNFMRSQLESMVLNLSPTELLLGGPLSKQTEKLLLAYAGPASNVRVERTSHDCFNHGGALSEVMSLYHKITDVHQTEDEVTRYTNKSQSLIQGIMSMPDLAVQALALSIRHLEQFGLERILCLGASFRLFSSKMEITLSANALQQLEILRNSSDGSESGSLLACMNHTLTIFGSRLLRHWVSHPLCDRNMIYARLDAVSEIAESMSSAKSSMKFEYVGQESGVAIVQPEIHHLISSVLTSLGRSPDVQRGITRIFHRTASASEFIAAVQAILVAGKQLHRLHIEEESDVKNMEGRTVRSGLLRKLILTASSSSIINTAAKLLSSLNREAADQQDIRNLFVVSDGKFPEVVEARKMVEFAKEKVELLIGKYRKQLQIQKLDFMSVSGVTHLIELPPDVKVPSNWVKVNSTKKTIRYHPPEVVAALDQLSLANEELNIVCRAAWDYFLREFSVHYGEFQAAVQALATLDCLHSLAILSQNKNYVRPEFVSDNEPVQINICSGRHPVLDTLLEDNFVPNDTNLHAEREYCQIVTGPNMGGKSCYIRQVALITIMAQVGSFVPSSSAKLYVVDGIYTRMGASDSIQQGRSTFLEELSEASHILKNCTSRSLVIIDELGRGTSTHDGVAIAYATLQYLLQQKRCMVLFVTHYPKIVDIKDEFPGSVGAYHVSYLTSGKDERMDSTQHSRDNVDVTYLYKLVPGVSERSFGFKVAQLAQLPSSCIKQAIVMAGELEDAVCNRRKNRFLMNRPGAPLPNVEERENILEALDDKFGIGFRELLANINSAFLVEYDDGKRLELLKHAKGRCAELLRW